MDVTKIALFGRVRAWRGKSELALGTHQQRALFAVLTLAGGEPVRLAELVDLFWSRPPATAVNTLQTYVKRLRRVLEPERPLRGPSSILPSVGDGYALRIDPMRVDALRFHKIAERVRLAASGAEHARVIRTSQLALALYATPCADIPLLAGGSRLAALEADRRRLLGWLLEAALASGRAEEALSYVEAAAAADPLDEAAQERLLRIQLALGRRAEGIAVYHRTRRSLAEALGIEAGPRLRRLYSALLSGGTVSEKSHPADTPAEMSRLVHEAARKLDAGGVVNVVGPVGIGKTTLLTRLAGANIVITDLSRSAPGTGPVVIVDQVDSPDAVQALSRLLQREPVPLVIAASRRPLLAGPRQWRCPIRTVRMRPWRDTEIAALARENGITDPTQQAVTVKLSGGIPLIGEYLCQALHLGAPPEAGGALVDGAVREIVRRLGTESASPATLHALASLGYGNAELLTGPDISALSALSVVFPAPQGLTVGEPYRTMFELAHRWRSPLTHHTLVTAALAHTRALVGSAPPGLYRARLLEQSLLVGADATVRDALFPPRIGNFEVRSANAGDAEDILRLTAQWARRGGLDPRRSERIIGPLLAADPAGFQVAVDDAGLTIGTVSSVPVTGNTITAMEPLLQSHSEALAGGGGVLVGMAFCADPAAHAALLRSIISVGVDAGQIIVSTTWGPYQALVRALDFRHHGDTEDIYRCGVPSQVHARQFAPEGLLDWLDLVTRAGLYRPAPGGQLWMVRQMRQALRHLHRPEVLAGNPLAVSGAADLRERLMRGIEAMADDSNPATAAAGRILAERYLRGRTQDELAARLGISRPTYFRRLRAAVALLAEHFS